MRVAILGNTRSPIKGRRQPHSWFVLTFRQGAEINGHEVTLIDYRSTPLNTIYDKLRNNPPRILFTHLSFHRKINPIANVLDLYSRIRKRLGTKVVHAMYDARTQDRYMGDLSGAVDMAFVGNTACVETCVSAWRIPVFYSPYSCFCQKEMARPVPELCFRELVFTGSPGSHEDRAAYISKLRRIVPVRIFSTMGTSNLRHRTAELAASAECILGFCTGYDIDHYIDVRPFQYLGAGACMIIRKFKGMDDVIPGDLYYPIDSYDNPSEVKDLFEVIKRTETIPMRRKAFEFMQRYHSCRARIADVIGVLEGKKSRVQAFLRDLM